MSDLESFLTNLQSLQVWTPYPTSRFPFVLVIIVKAILDDTWYFYTFTTLGVYYPEHLSKAYSALYTWLFVSVATYATLGSVCVWRFLWFLLCLLPVTVSLLLVAEVSVVFSDSLSCKLLSSRVISFVLDFVVNILKYQTVNHLLKVKTSAFDRVGIDWWAKTVVSIMTLVEIHLHIIQQNFSHVLLRDKTIWCLNHFIIYM